MEMIDKAMWFVCGAFVGSLLGVFVMCLVGINRHERDDEGVEVSGE